MKTVGYLPLVDGEIVAGKVAKNKGLAKIAANRMVAEKEKPYEPSTEQLLKRCFRVLSKKSLNHSC